MNHDVVDLDSRRRPDPEPTGRCACRPGWLCYPHRLRNLSGVIRDQRDQAEGELLLDADAVLDVWARALAVLDGIANECLPNDERTTR